MFFHKALVETQRAYRQADSGNENGLEGYVKKGSYTKQLAL